MYTNMLSTLIPFIALLAMVEGTEFEEPVRVDFLSSFASSKLNYIWHDITEYVPPELKDTLSGKDLFDNSVGQLFFTETTTSDTKRTFQWTKGECNNDIMHECSVSLTGDPGVAQLFYELSTGDKASPAGASAEMTDMLQVLCDEDITASSEILVPSSTSTGSLSTEAPAPTSWPLFKDPLLITFIAKPADLIDPTNVWWHDMTPYDTMLNGEWGALSDQDKKKNATSDAQVQIGQMAYAGLSPLAREYVWQPKSIDGKTKILECHLKIEFDPLVPEIWIWANSDKVEKIEPRKNGELLPEKDAEKFAKDHPVAIECTNVEDGSTVG